MTALLLTLALSPSWAQDPAEEAPVEEAPAEEASAEEAPAEAAPAEEAPAEEASAEGAEEAPAPQTPAWAEPSATPPPRRTRQGHGAPKGHGKKHARCTTWEIAVWDPKAYGCESFPSAADDEWCALPEGHTPIQPVADSRKWWVKRCAETPAE